jgi:hypothetical protein
MNIQEITSHVAQANVNLAEAGTLMSQAAREIDQLRADAIRLKRDHERFVNSIYALLNNDDLDGARDIARAEYLSIHGPSG